MTRAALAALTVLVGVGLGMLTLRAEHQYAGLRDAGADLNGMARLLAMGPSAVTAWPGWVAGACFALAVRRLGSGAPEPPAGRDGPNVSVSQLRAGQRAEFRLVRTAHLAVVGLTLLDAGRLLWFCAAAVTDGSARRGVVPLSVEVAGLAVAALVLRLWLRHFARQLELVSAL